MINLKRIKKLDPKGDANANYTKKSILEMEKNLLNITPEEYMQWFRGLTKEEQKDHIRELYASGQYSHRQ